MAYFNHAFCKSFLVDSLAGSAVPTQELAAGELGIAQGDWTAVDPGAFPTAAVAKNLLYFAQGSFMPNDKIGTHGGYQESVKTKGINPRYITRLWSSVCQDAQAATVTIDVAETCAPCGENLFIRLDVKGSPALRFLNHNAYALGDSSGSAAVNAVPGNCCVDGQDFLDPAVALAKAAGMLLEDPIITPFVAEGFAGSGIGTVTGAATTGALFNGTYSAVASTSAGSGTDATFTVVVAAGAITSVTAVAAGQDYVVGEALTIDGSLVGGVSTTDDITFTVATLATLGRGMTVVVGGVTTYYTIAEVLDGTYTPSTDPVTDAVTASVTFVGSYADTQFGDCSFDTRDHYEMEPVQLIGSVLDETGNPCNDCGVVTTTQGVMAQTHGETVLRDILLHERYLQSPYHQGSVDSVRIREIEGFDAIKAAVTRNALYKVYYLQHSIPRLSNPTGTFDNDQYVYQFFVPCLVAGVTNPIINDMDALFGDIATLCDSPYGNPITFDPLGIDQL
jgi:hypothetical protein